MDNNNKDKNDIDRKVLNGEKVPCPNCGKILLYQKAESGMHPSIICPSGDYHVRLNVNKSDILDRLGLTKRNKGNK
ncbi:MULTISPECIES: hypothetical protein [Paenibacillus]|uniref:hypothetical protein n=1 Tax=Paenibacillus TaxID=44249 RepID=UPI00298C24DA|nr:hypothetical protein [Paenibacillus polymyxa]MDY8091442.1 hypothetical protein [Paenibacillus polymyxa]